MRNPLQFIATLFTCLLMACGTAHGQQADAPVRAAVEQFLIEQTRGLPGRVELEISPIDSRNRLPACTRLIPAMPPGGRAWGRSSVTVRCDAPAPWTIYVEVQVRVFGEYLILARPVRAGQVIGPDDLARKSGDLTAEGEDLLGDMTAAIGHRTRVALAAGKPLRASMLLLPPAVRRGDTVRVITRGAGFSVANEGKALNDAAAGQNVRVRLGSGRVLSGQAREDGQVEVGP